MLSRLARWTRPLVLAAAAIGGITVVASPAHAQGQDGPCGDTSWAAQLLDHHFALFTDSARAAVRGHEIERLAPTDVHEVVTDPRVCRRVLKAVRRYLPPPGKWRLHMVFRFGPYYGVEILEKLPRGVRSTGYASLFLFRASDMSYVTLVLT